MATENPFYMWSIVEAWDWLAHLWGLLVHLPVVGFALLVVLGLFLLLVLLVINALFVE